MWNNPLFSSTSSSKSLWWVIRLWLHEWRKKLRNISIWLLFQLHEMSLTHVMKCSSAGMGFFLRKYFAGKVTSVLFHSQDCWRGKQYDTGRMNHWLYDVNTSRRKVLLAVTDVSQLCKVTICHQQKCDLLIICPYYRDRAYIVALFCPPGKEPCQSGKLRITSRWSQVRWITYFLRHCWAAESYKHKLLCASFLYFQSQNAACLNWWTKVDVCKCSFASMPVSLLTIP